MLAILATDKFGTGDGGTGLLLAARGVGVVAGPVFAGRIARTSDVPGILRVCAISCISYGITYALVGQSPTLAVALVLVLIAHLGGGAQWTLSTIGLQITTPDEMRGRIMAADFALATLSMTVSYSLAGVMESFIGVSGVLAMFGAFGVLWGLFYLRLTRSLRAELDAGPVPDAAAVSD
jgi:predicted MFS family arabinose efflux permease